MKLKNFLFVALGVLIGLFVARYTYGTYRFHHVAQHFGLVHTGDSAATVIEKLGKPNYHSGSCLQDLRLSKNCSTELVYSHPFAPLIPEYYVVDLARDGRVIETANLNSP